MEEGREGGREGGRDRGREVRRRDMQKGGVQAVETLIYAISYMSVAINHTLLQFKDIRTYM